MVKAEKVCSNCKGKGWVEGDDIILQCPKCSGEVSDDSGLPLWPGQPSQEVGYQKYSEGVADYVADRVGIYLTGKTGTGKTSAVVALVAAAGKAGISPVRYYRCREFVGKITEDWSGIQRIIDDLKRVKVLVIDDFLDADRGMVGGDARKVALDEILRAYVEGKGVLWLTSRLSMDEAVTAWGGAHENLLESAVVEVKLKKVWTEGRTL